MESSSHENGNTEGIYTKKMVIEAQHSVDNIHIGLGDLARSMQKITEEHMQAAGISSAGLKSEDKTWVISWSDIEITRMPECTEDIIMEVWTGKKRTGMYSRKYAIYAQNGEKLADVSSLFAVMDLHTRTMSAGTKPLDEMPVVERAGELKPPKMSVSFPEACSGVVERVVAAEEIDFNGHLNNSHYLDWAQDLAKEELGIHQTPVKVWIQYSKELLEGQQVRLKYTHEGQALYIKGSAADAESFAIKLQY